MHGPFRLRVAAFEGSGGEAELAYDSEFNALLLRRFVEDEFEAARAFGMRAHLAASRAVEIEDADCCWSGPVASLPEFAAAAVLTEAPARPLQGLDYVVDARALPLEELIRAASSIGCPYAPLLKRRGKNAFFPRLGWLNSKIEALSEGGLEAAAVELGPIDDPAEVISAYYAGLKLAAPAAPRDEIMPQAIQRAFGPRTKAAGRALQELFERAEAALGGADGIAALDERGLTRYIGGMKPLSVTPRRLARECAEHERVRSIARYAARSLEQAKSRLAAEGRACGRGRDV